MAEVIKPEDILGDDQNYIVVKGLKLRKGTVAAVLKNMDLIEDQNSTQEQIEAAYDAIKVAAPALVVLGLWQHVTFKNPKTQKYIDDAAEKLKAEGRI